MGRLRHLKTEQLFIVFHVGTGRRRMSVIPLHDSPAVKVDSEGQMRPHYTASLFLGGGD